MMTPAFFPTLGDLLRHRSENVPATVEREAMDIHHQSTSALAKISP